MDIRSAKQGGDLLITLAGEIDQVGSEKLKTALGNLDLSGVLAVKVDMSGVTYVGSAGVGKLLLLYKNLPSPDTPMHLTGLSPDILHLFREMELDEVFTLNRLV